MLPPEYIRSNLAAVNWRRDFAARPSRSSAQNFIMRRKTHATPCRSGKFLDAHSSRNMDDLLQLRRLRIHLRVKRGQQLVLNDVPALHDKVKFGSIRWFGRNDVVVITTSCCGAGTLID